VLALDEFFAIGIQEEDWHDQEEGETVKQFQNKVSVLKQNLLGSLVIRVISNAYWNGERKRNLFK
jgi:hypothetical protein